MSYRKDSIPPPPPYTEVPMPSPSEPSAPLLPSSQPQHYTNTAMPSRNQLLAPLLSPHPPSQPHYVAIRSVQETRHFPVNAAFFLLGWIFPPLWIFSCCCWNDHDRYERAWQKLNKWMAILTITSFIVFSIIFGILAEEELENTGPRPGDNLDPLPPLS